MSNITIKCNLSEDLFKKQLIELGWTPPKLKEPENQIIKLDKMVNSNIDMEFSNDLKDWFVDRLISINNSTHPYETANSDSYMYCRIRKDYWFYEPNGWGECPIHDGLEVILRSKYGGEGVTNNYINKPNWEYGSGDGTIVAFMVTGVANEWKYKGQKESNHG